MNNMKDLVPKYGLDILGRLSWSDMFLSSGSNRLKWGMCFVKSRQTKPLWSLNLLKKGKLCCLLMDLQIYCFMWWIYCCLLKNCCLWSKKDKRKKKILQSPFKVHLYLNWAIINYYKFYCINRYTCYSEYWISRQHDCQLLFCWVVVFVMKFVCIGY